MENKDILNIENIELTAEDFQFIQMDEKIHDKKFETKAVGYLGDAIRRFSRNKTSVVAFVILVIIILFSIFAPIFSKRDPIEQNHNYLLFPPKVPGLEKAGFMDGVKTYKRVNVDFIMSITDPVVKEMRQEDFQKYYFIEYIVNYESLEEIETNKYEEVTEDSVNYFIDIEYDVYARSIAPRWVIGATHDQYLKYREEGKIFSNENDEEIVEINKSAARIFEINPGLLPEGKTVEDYYVYNIYLTPDDNSEYFYFGTDLAGRDLWTRLWLGTRTSLLIGLFVAFFSITIGIIWGSISGYYGGTVDLVMERFIEILVGIPWIVLMILVKMFLTGIIPNTLIVAISLILTSWTGTAAMVRAQMYRYKNREYVLASRTFGAKDIRLIFKHILPNALGTIVTSTILIVPSAIFFESSVAYLGLGIDASTLSIGNLLSSGRETGIVEFPYLTVFPSLVISMLMISFNMFGNGLRDALNPSLRGVE